VTRNQINGYIWLTNTPLPQEICDREPLLKDYGLFRRLNDGNFEFISVCDARIKNFISMHKDDLARILNGTQKMLDQKAAIRALAPALPAGEDNR
jgi:hypothetical protein